MILFFLILLNLTICLHFIKFCWFYCDFYQNYAYELMSNAVQKSELLELVKASSSSLLIIVFSADYFFLFFFLILSSSSAPSSSRSPTPKTFLSTKKRVENKKTCFLRVLLPFYTFPSENIYMIEKKTLNVNKTIIKLCRNSNLTLYFLLLENLLLF